jgi:L-threonylcarbamoyladenylate synthase
MVINNTFDKIMKYINGDELIIYPTSTLPALGCKPNKIALDRLFEIKKRSTNLPVSLGVLDLEQVSDVVTFDNISVDLLNSFPKGSLTLLLPAKKTLDQRLGGDWIGIRPVIDNRARELISQSGPLTATSANISGKEPSKDCKEAAKELKFKQDQYIPGVTNGGLPSTLVKVDKKVTVMREGVISRKEVVAWSMKMI